MNELTGFSALFVTGLYYLDSAYEQVVRLDLPEGDNKVLLMNNTEALNSLKVFSKRPGERWTARREGGSWRTRLVQKCCSLHFEYVWFNRLRKEGRFTV